MKIQERLAAGGPARRRGDELWRRESTSSAGAVPSRARAAAVQAQPKPIRATYTRWPKLSAGARSSAPVASSSAGSGEIAMKASDTRELTEVARENEVKRLEEARLGLRTALAGLRSEQYQDARELKIRAHKAAQLAAVERRLWALRQGRLL
jgi:hypothetical protein